jgi:hypothetical protein
MNTVEATATQTVLDPLRRQPQLDELATSDDAMLRRRKGPDD